MTASSSKASALGAPVARIDDGQNHIHVAARDRGLQERPKCEKVRPSRRLVYRLASG